MLLVSRKCVTIVLSRWDWIMSANLLVLNKMIEFDIVLEMTLLSWYYATIDCESQVVTFRELGQNKLVYQGCIGLKTSGNATICLT